jgi:hypothetical protein
VEYIYACLFSNGFVKVGRSGKPLVRIKQHENRGSCFGIKLLSHEIRQCLNESSSYCENILIEKCVINSTSKNKKEWFLGLDYDEVCLWLAEIASHEREVIVEEKEPAYEVADVDEHSRYFITWPNGYSLGAHVWNDRKPHLPHWPESAVMRWDMRKDWDKIWYELIDHPCAIYFAPNHPDRVGNPVFADWVKSWPESFDDMTYLDNMPQTAQDIVKAIWPKFR